MKLAILGLGRRGASVQLTSRLFEAAREMQGVSPAVVVSRSNEMAGMFETLGPDGLFVDTVSALGPLGLLTNYLRARRRILHCLQEMGTQAVFTVMPHVWTPLLARDIQRLGIKYATLIHDVGMHPGDPTALATRWLLSEAKRADLVVTMSQSVTEQLRRVCPDRHGRIVTAFHPDFTARNAPSARKRSPQLPLRILFFGRILAYKGLPMLVDAFEDLKARNVPVTLCVAGEGDLGAQSPRLAALGAEVHNRWFSEAGMHELFAGSDAAVLSHAEASQSGIPALAYAHGLPVVATPVGGLKEQVDHGRTGLLATDTSARALADAIERLATDSALYDRCSANIVAGAERRSPARFMALLAEEISSLLRDSPAPSR
ncbi:glycosyltransferase family 4 protein [Oricola nitratireducens]|uniref:glycosyltransferase family 4 protein n=1 Tax=Oricola nitratireducens TaxID=2775868 RepID=UPI00186822B0|nr:glycosyltransferase family 4 protein [Oricola nitratireducens]